MHMTWIHCISQKKKNGVVNKDLVNVVVKTVFTDKELLKKMNKTYAEKLAKKRKSSVL